MIFYSGMEENSVKLWVFFKKTVARLEFFRVIYFLFKNIHAEFSLNSVKCHLRQIKYFYAEEFESAPVNKFDRYYLDKFMFLSCVYNMRNLFSRREIFSTLIYLSYTEELIPYTSFEFFDFEKIHSDDSVFVQSVLKYLGRFDIYFIIRREYLLRLSASSPELFSDKNNITHLDLELAFSKSVNEYGRGARSDSLLSSATFFFSKMLSSKDASPEYRDYICLRNILLTGPSVNQELGDHQGGHDTIHITLNHKITDLRSPDVSYYNCGKLDFYVSRSCVPDLAWIVGKCDRSSFNGSFSSSFRVMSRFTSGTEFTYNLLPLVLFDLYCHSVDSVSLSGFDMMLSVGRRPGYVSETYLEFHDLKMDSHHFNLSSFRHDPTLNFIPLWFFWKIGFIKITARLENILSGGLQRYLVDLSSVHLRRFDATFDNAR